MLNARYVPAMKTTCDSGSASVFTVGLLGVVLTIGISVIAVCAVLSAKTHVQGVADLAALAGGKSAAVSVYAAVHAQESCQIVQWVAQENDLSVQDCQVRDGDVYVHVVKPFGWGYLTGNIHGYARAGER